MWELAAEYLGAKTSKIGNSQFRAPKQDATYTENAQQCDEGTKGSLGGLARGPRYREAEPASHRVQPGF